MADKSIVAYMLVSVTTLAYLNDRYIGLQRHVFMTIASLLVTVVLAVINHVYHQQQLVWFQSRLAHIDFRHVLLNGMLSFLLFAGGLSVDYSRLKRFAHEIFGLALLTTAMSTLIIGGLLYGIDYLLGGTLSFGWSCLFGALISPTDPIAVLAMLKNFDLPESMTIKLSGESLFNDGIGIVIFFTILHCVTSGGHGHPVMDFIIFFCRSTLGGLAYGALVGYIVQAAILRNKDIHFVMLATITVPVSGYFFAESFEFSGPLAMVVSGLIIGHRARAHLYNEVMERGVRALWHFVDEFLNLILFMMIGLESVVLKWTPLNAVYMFGAIVVVLFSRWLSVASTLRLVEFKVRIPPHTHWILFWGGLRGGLAIALALSLPLNYHRDMLIAMTYSVVIFSVIGQGLTIQPLARRLMPAQIKK